MWQLSFIIIFLSKDLSNDIAWDLTDLKGHAKGYQVTIGRIQLKLAKAKSLQDQIRHLVQKPGV